MVGERVKAGGLWGFVCCSPISDYFSRLTHQLELSHVFISNGCSLSVAGFWTAQLNGFILLKRCAWSWKNGRSKMLDLLHVSVELFKLSASFKTKFGALKSLCAPPIVPAILEPGHL